jgi:fatty acid desaturase
MATLDVSPAAENALASGKKSAGVRESMRVLPRWLQPILTEMTGTPLEDEQPLIRWTGFLRLVLALTVFGAGLTGGIVIIQAGVYWWWLLPMAWVLTVSAARSFQTSFVHHAAHGTLWGQTRLDRWLQRRLPNRKGSMADQGKPRHYVADLVAELLSTMVWIAPLSVYREDHIPHHGQLATGNDPDLRFMVDLGMQPGLSVRTQRARYWRSLFSPRFHWVYLRARWRANFVRPPRWRAALAAAYTAGVVALAWWHPVTLLMAVVIPIFPLYHIAGLMNMTGEHHWVRLGEAYRGNSRKVILSRLTTARFFGEATPASHLKGAGKVIAWSGWWFRLLAVHFPARLFAVPGDLANHDWHHRYPFDARWPAAAYARRDDALRGTPGWPAYTESWGLKPAREATFELLSRLPRDAELGKPLTYGELSQLVLGM